jgi:starch phosphorylase
MKASLNGVLNVSISDGWWIEGYNGENGWTFGCASDDNRDQIDAQQLYDILEQEVIPLYYTVSVNGIPHGWITKMKETMKSTASRFSARRMVKEYVHQAYIPALMDAEKYENGKT